MISMVSADLSQATLGFSQAKEATMSETRDSQSSVERVGVGETKGFGGSGGVGELVHLGYCRAAHGHRTVREPDPGAWG